MKKPRADSRLKVLEPDRQAEIAGLLEKQSLAAVREILAGQGLKTSLGALSEFWTWWQLRESLRRREERVGGLLEELRREQPDIGADRLFELGQSVFGAMAIAEEDAKAWYLTQQTALKRREIEQRRTQGEQAMALKTQELRLAREKYERETCLLILKAVKDERVREIEASGVPQEEMIRELRAHYFKDVEDLEKSGGVELPP